MASYPEINATFPRARARGPIEAMTHLSRLMGTGQFPRARARGPIEALVRWRRRRCRWDFRERALAAPLKQNRSETRSRGPRISASGRSGPHWSTARARSNVGELFNFRERALAAPLKLLALQAPLFVPHHFRERALAAPLKPGIGRTAVGNLADFRERALAAPLKPLKGGLTWQAGTFPRARARGPIEAEFL